MKKLSTGIAISFILCSCSAPKQDPESFLIYSYIFESLSGQYESGPSAKEFWDQSGRPCFFNVEGARYSYVSALVDIGFGVTPWNENMNIEQESAAGLLKHMVVNGCSLDEPHPFTGHTPAHSSALFTKKNYELAEYVLLNSKNISQKTPSSDPHFPSATALDILQKISSKYQNQEQRIELIHNIEQKTHNKSSKWDAVTGAPS